MIRGLGVVISMCLCDGRVKAKHFNSVMDSPSQVPLMQIQHMWFKPQEPCRTQITDVE